MLIENSENIGKVPDEIIADMLSINNKKSKKKRRSGSITRMFTGLRKIVGTRHSEASEFDDSLVSSLNTSATLGKRKKTETNASSKK